MYQLTLLAKDLHRERLEDADRQRLVRRRPARRPVSRRTGRRSWSSAPEPVTESPVAG